MLEITPYGTRSPGFTIRDEQGITYTFFAVETTKMVSSDEKGQANNNWYLFPSSWFLSRVESADGKEVIDFDYWSTRTAQLQHPNFLQNESASCTYGEKGKGLHCSKLVADFASYISPAPSISIARKFLKKISLFREGKLISYVELVSGTGRSDSDFPEDRVLQQLKIYSSRDHSGSLVQQFDLRHGYFGGPQDPAGKKRLRLEAVQEMAVDGKTPSKPPYSFAYNTSSGSLPDRATADLDHWGFYNAAGNKSLVPNISVRRPGRPDLVVGKDAYREASFEGSSATILTKMTYPTGGYSTFEYELNQGWFPGNIVRVAGGLRIKRIVDYSFENRQAVARNYTYTQDDGATSGRGGILPVYSINSTYQHYQEPFSYGHDTECETRLGKVAYGLITTTVSANSIMGLGSFQGSHLGYQQVTEFLTDVTNGQPLGKTVYRYRTGDMHEYEEDIGSGDLTGQSVFDNNGKLLKEMAYEYKYNFLKSIYAFTVQADEFQTNKKLYCRTSSNYFRNYGDWEKRSQECVETRRYATRLYLNGYGRSYSSKQLVQQTEKIYDQLSDAYLTSTKTMTYGNGAHAFPGKIEQTTTEGEVMVTERKYAGDYVMTAWNDEATKGLLNLVSKNILGAEVESVQYRQKADGSRRRYISGSVTTYHSALPYPEKVYRLEVASPLTSLESSAVKEGVFILAPEYQLAGSFRYDAGGNLLEQAKAHDRTTTYLWEGNLVAASVENAASEVTAYSGFESKVPGSSWVYEGAGINARLALTGRSSYDLSVNLSIKKELPAAAPPLIVSYWATTAGVRVTVNDGLTVPAGRQGKSINGWTFFEHQLPAGISRVELLAEGVTIDELRLYPRNAQMTTYCYQPLVGVTSTCDANNRFTFYEYDGLGRLVEIKDEQGNILKNIAYNFGLGAAVPSSEPTMFYNEAAWKDFTKTGCPEGSFPTTHTYGVPYGKYVSSKNQAEADAQAKAEVDANGQHSANRIGQCIYYSAARQGRYFKNDCPDGERSFFYVYWVPAGTYSSTLSQEDADTKARADMDANGQRLTNLYGYCPSTAVYLNLSNTSNSVGWATYKNRKSGYTYSFRVLPGTGTYPVPPGEYDINISVAGADGYWTFSVGCQHAPGTTSASFKEVVVSAEGCNQLIISNGN
ncbi:DUF5977 domain-containing protein [Paraflavisolibacter sp. H34]|uniref:DUF5977 domain-containing protein n=1 Tax=Huijunlia imazamoxiresistens TaxID=3127457 RepID=UPI00301596A2